MADTPLDNIIPAASEVLEKMSLTAEHLAKEVADAIANRLVKEKSSFTAINVSKYPPKVQDTVMATLIRQGYIVHRYKDVEDGVQWLRFEINNSKQ
jgi:hypothetical protein